MDLDLDPRHYRLKGSKPVKYLSSKLFSRLAIAAGIFAGGFWFAFTQWFYIGAGWIVLVIALTPGLVLFFTWLLLGGEDSVDPPAKPRGQRRRSQRPEHNHWRIVPRD